MSVSSISSLTSSASLNALLGNTSTSLLNSSSAASGATDSASSDAVTVDLSAIAKAASAGDTSGQAAATKQLKADLANEQTALVSSLMGGTNASSDGSSSLLSSIYSMNGNSTLASLAGLTGTTTGSTIDTTA